MFKRKDSMPTTKAKNNKTDEKHIKRNELTKKETMTFLSREYMSRVHVPST
uniref:Uncharacterized protein n=1 Tax=Arion vulgaris TaxID=1028688 RepID=A0A0B7AWD1_9EUPU